MKFPPHTNRPFAALRWPKLAHPANLVHLSIVLGLFGLVGFSYQPAQCSEAFGYVAQIQTPAYPDLIGKVKILVFPSVNKKPLVQGFKILNPYSTTNGTSIIESKSQLSIQLINKLVMKRSGANYTKNNLLNNKIIYNS